MSRIAMVNISIVLFLIIGRLMVPTEIDLSVTSVYKNFAHIMWGMCFLYSLQMKSKTLHAFVWGSALFELACALLNIGGLP